MVLECKLSYNDKSYGKGKAYIARILGEDPIYKLKRNFIEKDIEYINGSKTTWYKYKWSLSEKGVYEWYENNNFKVYREYFIYDNELDEIKLIKMEEVMKGIS